ncbi:TspO/MBR family protein [Pseudoalteromonas sp. SSDWG2]|uniref:TspO/MBR family protein n=1 Tax=Pseudoalteromonas sp. SSDWG2 TaxID=3139391 RepID=UPI003BAA95AC
MEELSFIEWYNTLAKPSWTPQPAFIGLMWQILYPLIFISFAFIFIQTFRRKLELAIAVPFIVNLVANLAFTPIQFGLRNLPLASVDIIVVWLSIVWIMVVIWPRYRVVALMQIPYFIWVSVATYLQISITIMNW